MEYLLIRSRGRAHSFDQASAVRKSTFQVYEKSKFKNQLNSFKSLWIADTLNDRKG
jgi:hypothetical protein